MWQSTMLQVSVGGGNFNLTPLTIIHSDFQYGIHQCNVNIPTTFESVDRSESSNSIIRFRKLLIRCIFAYLTIIPRARMGSESIAHEAEGQMGY